MNHANDDVIARGGYIPSDPDNGEGTNEVITLELFLDDDAVYRWYEDGGDTEATGSTIHEALAAARSTWPGFGLVEFRGEAVTADASDLPDAYAADEIEETADEPGT
jgi:hypothetical protein